MSYTYRYPRPMVTVDVYLQQEQHGQSHILLIQRRNDPFAGRWALPGGFVDKDEALEIAAKRELEEETGLKDVALAQIIATGTPGRDPRGHTVSIVYGAVIATGRQLKPHAADDASDAKWFALDALPPLAFDHAEIIAQCRVSPLLQPMAQ